ncbi:MAG: M56 family metallopeptidase [Lachnospiraceae bacterium]|nr:M56 family metallopeptidase [Lachnospiraceae bacterium]
MQLSVTSIFSILVFSLLFSIVLAIILGNTKLLKMVKCEVVLVCLAVPVLKMLLPIEIMPWTINVDVRGSFGDYISWLNKRVPIGENSFYSRWEIITAVMVLLGLLNVTRELLLYYVYLHNMNKLPELEDVKLRQTVDTIICDYGRRNHIYLKETSLVTAPSIVGLHKTIILIPVDYPAELEKQGVLRHEIAHFVYGDIWIRFIWSLVKAFYFWNPVIYILDSQLIKVLEIRADEKAVKNMTSEQRQKYRITLVKLANRAGKQKQNKYGVAFLHKKGMLVKKRIDLLETEHKRTRSNLIANYAVMVMGAISLFVVMNCFILEPIAAAPLEEYEGAKMVTEDNYFLVKNSDGTYDMYMDGVYCATIDETYGMELPVYNSLEEVLGYEEK